MPNNKEVGFTRGDEKFAVPQTLDHRPVYSLDYLNHDGYQAGNTDAKCLSIGLAQYGNHSHVTLKVFRHSGKRWSRQSEELPLHRAVDLTLLLAKALFAEESQEIILEPDSLFGQPEILKLIQDPKRTSSEIAAYTAFLDKNREALQKRLGALADELTTLRANGKI